MPGRTRWRRWYPSICSRRYTKIAGCSGRGPTIFMSPTSTFKSCGSSSSRNFRSTRPIDVTRASSGCAQTCGSRGADATRIVRNLYIVNGMPPWSRRRRVLPPARDSARRSRPMRVCLNRTGPREVSLIKTAINNNKGDVATNAVAATAVLRTWRSHRSRSRGRAGTRWTSPRLGREVWTSRDVATASVLGKPCARPGAEPAPANPLELKRLE